jgi:hypothetical protein
MVMFLPLDEAKWRRKSEGFDGGELRGADF